MTSQWLRPLSILTLILFLVSTLFPVAAGLARNTESFPKWWGALDVALAFILALLAFTVLALGQSRISQSEEIQTYRAYRVLIHSLFVFLLIFFLFGNHVAWNRCLTGFVWRSWLLLYVLPAWIAAYHTKA